MKKRIIRQSILLIAVLTQLQTAVWANSTNPNIIEIMIQDDIYRITVHLTSSIDKIKTQDLVLKRSAELAIEKNFTHFSILKQSPEVNVKSKKEEIYTLDIDLSANNGATFIRLFNETNRPSISYNANAVLSKLNSIGQIENNAKPRKVFTPSGVNLSLNLNLANKFSTSDLTATINNKKYGGSASAKTEQGIGLALGYSIVLEETIRNETGFFYDLPKSIDSVDFELEGTTLSADLVGEKMSIQGWYSNMVFNTDFEQKFDLFFGFNISNAKIDGLDIDTGYGYQFGISKPFEDRIRFELVYRHIQFSAEEKGSNYKAVYNHITHSGLILQTKLDF